ncbi:MAG: RES family NAD+ phosphorylase, partial [Chitinophagaceae bacterium]
LMEVYHIGSPKYASQLNGEGPKLHGGRWNSIGVPCIYTSESISLCVLEYAANVGMEQMPASLAVTVFTMPDKGFKQIKFEDLPENWQKIPPPSGTKLFGDQSLKK